MAYLKVRLVDPLAVMKSAAPSALVGQKIVSLAVDQPEELVYSNLSNSRWQTDSKCYCLL